MNPTQLEHTARVREATQLRVDLGLDAIALILLDHELGEETS